jgi:hypothetical protein
MTVVEMLERKRSQDREWDELATEMVRRGRGQPIPAYAVTIEQRRLCALRGEEYIPDLILTGAP